MTDVYVRDLKAAIFQYIGQRWSGTATATSTDAKYLTDSVLADLGDEDFPFPAENRQVYIVDGNAAGDLRRVARVEKDSGTLRPAGAFTAPITDGDQYELWGNIVHGGASLLAIINDALRKLRYLRRDAATIEDGRGTYNLSSLVDRKHEVAEVYVREWDTSGKTPYREWAIDSWQVREGYVLTGTDMVRSGTPTGGTWRLIYGGMPTDDLANSATAATIQTALREIPGLENCTVTLQAGAPPDATFRFVAAAAPTTHPNAAIDLPLSADLSSLTGGTPVIAFTPVISEAVLLDTYPVYSAPTLPNIQTRQIQVEYWDKFAAFTADDDTIDSKYQDWIVAETVALLAVKKIGGKSDTAAWRGTMNRAIADARTARRNLFGYSHYRPNHEWAFKGH